MCNANCIAAGRSWTSKLPLDLQLRDSDSNVTNVDDGIDGTDFMKVNLLVYYFVDVDELYCMSLPALTRYLWASGVVSPG